MLSQTNSKRYFGLTLVQLIALGCLVMLLCGLLGGMGWWVVRSNRAAAAPTLIPSVDLPTPIPTQTPVPTTPPPPTPTPTATLVPYEALVPVGCNQFLGGGVELWLPPGYVGGNLLEDRAGTIARVQALGPRFDGLVLVAQQSPPNMILVAADTTENTYLVNTNVNVMFDLAPVNDLDAYLDASLAQLPADWFVVEKRPMTIGGNPARRILVQFNMAGYQMEEAIYMILDGDTVWLVTYACHINMFYNEAPVFEQSAQTFRIVP